MLGIFLLWTVLGAEPSGATNDANDPPSPIRLRVATFDPLRESLELVHPGAGRLVLVQFRGVPREAQRAQLREAGVVLSSYVPENAYVARVAPEALEAIRRFAFVRWVGPYAPAFRMPPQDAAFVAGRSVELGLADWVLVPFDAGEARARLAADVRTLGGSVPAPGGGRLLRARLSAAQARRVVALDDVLWMERDTPVGLDLDHARIQGGADHVEAQGGITGSGVNVHVYEGVDLAHPDFTIVPTVVGSCATSSTHGHQVAGVIFGNGTSHPAARGIAPDARPFVTNFQCLLPGMTSWQLANDLVGVHEVMLTNASWGRARTTAYTAHSAEVDGIVFDHDLPWTQANGNGPGRESRPEAWAKNVVSVGGVEHFDNDERDDDSFGAGGASAGPAADGRIKPDLVGYYTNVHTSYPGGTSNPSFGGTSAAAPMVAGHLALAIQMFTDGLFPAPLRVPGGTRFQNRPHASTLKALMIANARQYAFDGTARDNRREQQGWGFPDVKTLWENRAHLLVVDETVVLTQGQVGRHAMTVPAGAPQLKVALCWTDPPANPAAALALVNDLTLHVLAPDGTLYRGNHGLTLSTVSAPGGVDDGRDSVECVFVDDPLPGTWTIEVHAVRIALDGHVETPAVDADYGLCATLGVTISAHAPFGRSCSGSLGRTPRLAVQGFPDLGRTSTLTLDGAPPSAALTLAFGVSQTLWNGVPLPLDLTGAGATGCSLWTSVEAALPAAADPSGALRLPFPIPVDPSLLGAQLHAQAIAADPGANPLGITTTNGVVLILGEY